MLVALFIFVCVAEADSRAIWPFPQPALRVPHCPCMANVCFWSTSLVDTPSSSLGFRTKAEGCEGG